VLDAHPTRQGFRSESRTHFLLPRVENPDDIATHLLTSLERDHLINEENPLPNNPFLPSDIEAAIASLIEKNLITHHADLLLHAPWWKEQLDAAGKAIKNWHQKRPDIPSMPLDELRKSLPDIPAFIFDHLPSAMKKQGYKSSGKGLASDSHTLTLPDEIAAEANSILKTLEQTGLQPPNKSELITNARLDQAMKFLIRSGQIIELEPKIVISTKARDVASEKVKTFLIEKGQATASELRQHLDSTRKVVMPLLEHLDTIGLTVRNENFRTLK